MGLSQVSRTKAIGKLLILFLIVSGCQGASLQDIFNLQTSDIVRIPREAQYYDSGRYGSTQTTGQTASTRPINPEEAPEARERDTNVEKRCTRCDYYNRDYRNPYESRRQYDDRYEDRGSRDRYDDRYRDRYDDYDSKRYYDTDRRYETDRRYYDYDRRTDDRDRYERYDRRPEYHDRYYDRYDRDRYDKDDRSRYYDRYDRYDRGGYRPWDETTRGSSGFDSTGRGYYFAIGRPEYSNSGSGYASNWNYGGGRDHYKDKGWREQGFTNGSYRPRDPYDSGYNRGTSYLYGRPSSTTTTQSPGPSGSNAVTANPDTLSNASSG